MKKTKIISVISLSILCSGCIPVALGGAAVVGGTIASEKGFGNTVSDLKLKTSLRMKLDEYDETLSEKIRLDAYKGELMLMGHVPSNEQRQKINELAWKLEGVKSVFDNIQISETDIYKNSAKDQWIETQLKSKLLVKEKVHSMNYSVSSVQNIVYIMGVSINQEEAKQVLEIARKIKGVEKVVSYIRNKEVVIAN